MRDIAIYGAGGFGREVACLIRMINEKEPIWNLVGFFDDGVDKGVRVSGSGYVVGGMKELNSWPKPLDLVICIGNPVNLRGVKERIQNDRISFPNIIHPDFRVSDIETYKIGIGNIIQGGCYTSCNVTIGNFNVINGDISFGHDDVIGDFNVLMPALRISGEVTIGNENLIGVGSIILQQVKVGNRVHLGAGAVLMTKPKDGGTYIGNPAKLFKF